MPGPLAGFKAAPRVEQPAVEKKPKAPKPTPELKPPKVKKPPRMLRLLQFRESDGARWYPTLTTEWRPVTVADEALLPCIRMTDGRVVALFRLYHHASVRLEFGNEMPEPVPDGLWKWFPVEVET